MKAKIYLFILPLISLCFIHSLYGQIPSVSSFTPTKGPVGTPVTITGSNFSSTPGDNIVYFGAIRATVSTATATTLTVDVPLGATYHPITVTVAGLTAYSVSPFVVTFNSNYIIDESTFAEKVDFATNTTSPIEIGGGDFDDDGKIDLLFTDNLGDALSVLKNQGSAGAITTESFEQKIDFTTGYGPHGYAIADVDGDGKLDIATVHNGTTVLVFRNTGTSGVVDASSFTLSYEYFVDFNIGLTDIAVADLDVDGKPDLVITDQWTTNRVLVLRNTSVTGVIDNQSFSEPVSFSSGVSPMAVATADIDGDGKSEIIVTNNGGVAAQGNTISVFKNTTTTGVIDASSFSTKVDFTTGGYPSGLAVGDIDGDHKPDIAVTNYGSASISVLKNQATLGVIDQDSFLPQVNFATGTGPYGIAMSDLDGDGKIDLAVTNSNFIAGGDLTRTISIFKNTTTTTVINSDSFAGKVDFKTGASPMGIFIGDMDGDGKPDLSVVNNKSFTISVLRNKDSQTITSFANIADKKMGDPSFTLSATASSELAVQFTNDSDKITITGSQVTIVKPGSVTITAEQPGDNTFSAAPKISQTFCINPLKPTITVNISDVAQPILTSSSDIGNKWYLNGSLIEGATAKTYVVKEKGMYTVKVEVDGCVSPVSEGETFIVTGDVDNSTTKVQLFPNPVHDLLTLQLYGFKEDGDVSIVMIDGIGKTVSDQIGKGGQEITVDVKNYDNGPYYIIMRQGRSIQQAKFIKK
jgi:IPT/TIG domain-containing protein/VCBS repeat protein/type IX secretion system substrate protein